MSSLQARILFANLNTVYRENFAHVLFSPFHLRANLKLGQLNFMLKDYVEELERG